VSLSVSYASPGVDSSHNLVTDSFGAVSSSFTRVIPAALSLIWQNNMLIVAEGSQAIDTGNNTTCETIDQRGWGRPVDGDKDGSAICDIGTYEYVPGIQFIYLPLLLKDAK